MVQERQPGRNYRLVSNDWIVSCLVLGARGICVRLGWEKDFYIINHLKTKRRPLYLKTQFVPRCKHFSSRL